MRWYDKNTVSFAPLFLWLFPDKMRTVKSKGVDAMKKHRVAVITLLAVMLLAGCQQRTADPADSLQDTEAESISSFSGGKTETTESESDSSDMAANTEESKAIETSPAETDSLTETSEPPIQTESINTVTTPEKKDDTQTKPGEAPQKEPEPAKTAETASEKKPEVTVTPEPTKESEPASPPAPEPKSIYDYEFDVEAIRQELISIGTGMGLTHTGDMTPDTASWSTPITASADFQGENLERRLKDYVQSMPELIAAYGGTTIQYFTIYAEPLGGGSYRIYFLY